MKTFFLNILPGFWKPVEFLNTLFSSCRKFMRGALNTDIYRYIYIIYYRYLTTNSGREFDRNLYLILKILQINQILQIEIHINKILQISDKKQWLGMWLQFISNILDRKDTLDIRDINRNFRYYKTLITNNGWECGHNLYNNTQVTF